MSKAINREDGIGIVTALMVAFIVFSLGAVWYSVSTHELDETTYDRNRTTALHVADAGVRQAMYELSQTTLKNDPFWTGNGVGGGGACTIENVTTIQDGTTITPSSSPTITSPGRTSAPPMLTRISSSAGAAVGPP